MRFRASDYPRNDPRALLSLSCSRQKLACGPTHTPSPLSLSFSLFSSPPACSPALSNLHSVAPLSQPFKLLTLPHTHATPPHTWGTPIVHSHLPILRQTSFNLAGHPKNVVPLYPLRGLFTPGSSGQKTNFFFLTNRWPSLMLD